jgi:hypothetical protein
MIVGTFAVRLLLAAIAVHLTLAADANARCRPCTVGESECVPKGGILIFTSVRPNVPVSSTMRASHRRPLDGCADGSTAGRRPSIRRFRAFPAERAMTSTGVVRRGFVEPPMPIVSRA